MEGERRRALHLYDETMWGSLVLLLWALLPIPVANWCVRSTWVAAVAVLHFLSDVPLPIMTHDPWRFWFFSLLSSRSDFRQRLPRFRRAGVGGAGPLCNVPCAHAMLCRPQLAARACLALTWRNWLPSQLCPASLPCIWRLVASPECAAAADCAPLLT